MIDLEKLGLFCDQCHTPVTPTLEDGWLDYLCPRCKLNRVGYPLKRWGKIIQTFKVHPEYSPDE